MGILVGPFDGVQLDGGSTRAQAFYRVTWPRGTGGTIRVYCYTASGAALPVAGPAGCKLSIRFLPTDPTPLVSRVGVPNVGLGTNVIDFPMVAIDTVNAPPGDYWWDVQYLDAAGAWSTLIPFSPWIIPVTPGLPTDTSSAPANMPLPVLGLNLQRGSALFTPAGSSFSDVTFATAFTGTPPLYAVLFGVYAKNAADAGISATALLRGGDGGPELAATGFRIQLSANPAVDNVRVFWWAVA